MHKTNLRDKWEETYRRTRRRGKWTHHPENSHKVKLDGKYSERVQLPAKAIADCHHNGGARLMEQPLPQCWSTNHVPSWMCIFGMFTRYPQDYPIARFGGCCRQHLATLAASTIRSIKCKQSPVYGVFWPLVPHPSTDRRLDFPNAKALGFAE